MAAVDGDVGFAAEDRDDDLDLGLAVSSGLRVGVLHRPARVGVILARLGGFVGPDVGRFSPALIRAFSATRLRSRRAATSVATTIWPAISIYLASVIGRSSLANSASTRPIFHPSDTANQRVHPAQRPAPDRETARRRARRGTRQLCRGMPCAVGRIAATGGPDRRGAGQRVRA